ncbi:MAG TPA: restriction endonuclease subunit S [Sphingobacterium bovisgrunnientis]|nr:restriction endonuclease subunit S [Sphingobacterium bovisgrunnientis]
MNRFISLKSFISNQKSGDWGRDSYDEKYNFKVYCIRGADINAVNEGNYENLPLRYIESKNKTKLLEEGNIIIEISGGSPTQSTGRVSYVRGIYGNIICSNFCRAYEIKSEHSAKYFYYLIKNIYNSGVFFNFESKTTGIKNLLIESAFDNIKVPDFDLPTQQKIAAVLSALDDKIELNNTINTELEAMAKTLYDYWFVQFEFPNSEGKPYKSSGGAMEYNSTLKREMPKGWEDGIFVDIAKLIRGVSYTKDDIKSFESSDDIKILRATNIHGNRIDLNDPVIVPSKFVKEEQLLNPFDILITMSSGSIDHIGKNGFYYFDDKASFGAFCAKVETELLNRFYVYLFMQSKVFTITIKNECLGTNINNLNGSMVNNFKVLKPTDEILIRFNKIIAPIFEKIAINSKQNQELAQLRDWLLPMLMNGQVKVVDEQYNTVNNVVSMAAESNTNYSKGSQALV